MKKLVSSVLAFLFIGSTGIPVSASSPHGYKRPSINRIDSNSDFQKLNRGEYRLKPGERVVKEKDYFGLQKDNGEAIILDINNKIKGFIKYRLDTNAKEGLVSNDQDLGDCLAGIATLIAGGFAVYYAAPLVVEAISAFGLEAIAYYFYEVTVNGKEIWKLPALVASAIGALKLIIGIPENCFGA